MDGLRSRGIDALILDHCSPRASVREWRCALRPTLPTPVPREDRPLYAAKARTLLAAVESLPRSPSLPLDAPEAWPQHETVVVGSDEVWNLHHPFYGGHPTFFGEGVRARRLVAHAATFGTYAAETVAPEWVQRLARFDAITVRDESSARIVANACGFSPPVVLDPCLHFPPAAPAVRHRDDAFVVVYGHNFSASFSRAVRAWADARAVRLVSVGYRNDWAHEQWISASPDEFAAAMHDAQGVATNFFHGCVFALRFATPFVCEAEGYRWNKVRSLTSAVGAEARMVSGDVDACVARSLGEPLHPDVLETVARLRKVSDESLDAALAC